MAKKQKYYVVWQGNAPGIYDSWADCQKQVTGVAGAQYKSFDSLSAAQSAFNRPYAEVKGTRTTKESMVGIGVASIPPKGAGSIPGVGMSGVAGTAVAFR